MMASLQTRRLAVFFAALAIILATGAVSAASIAYCNSYVSAYLQTCINDISMQDEKAYATNRIVDSHRATDPYHIYFARTSWYPKVYRGDPVYYTYWIYDSQNGRTIYVNNNYYGAHLTDYPSGLGVPVGVTSGYYPGKRASTVLEMRSAPPWSCGLCMSYTQLNDYTVR